MLKCPKSVLIRDISYPYGGTPYCPYMHIPCVLDLEIPEACGLAMALLITRERLVQVFNSTVIVGIPDSLRDNADIIANWDMAAEMIVGDAFDTWFQDLFNE